MIGGYRIDRYTAELNALLFDNTTTDIKVKPTLKSPRARVVCEPNDVQTY